MKISYGSTWNIRTIINSYAAKILYPKKSTEQRTCSCLNKGTCPLEQKCLTTNIVYKAKVTSNNRNFQEKVYFGLCKTTFKKGFSIHKKLFNLHEYKKEIRRIKSSGHHAKVEWEIIKNVFHITHKQNAAYYT